MKEKIKKVSQWYITKVKKSPAAMIAGSIIALFAVFGSLYGGAQGITHLYGFIERSFFENKILYQELEKITIGMNISFLKSIFGEPAIKKKLPAKLTDYIKNQEGKWEAFQHPSEVDKYTEIIYVHKKYYLQVIINEEGRVVAYAVTTRDSNFNPEIPIGISFAGGDSIDGLKLGKMTLRDLRDYEPTDTNIGNWGMFYFYVEADYFGNPGFYKHYLFGLSYSGCCLTDEAGTKLVGLGMREEDKSINNRKIKDFRLNLEPNTFGVIDGWNNLKLLDYFIKVGVGANYYDIREFD